MPERPGSLPLAELVAEQRARLSLSLAAVAKRMGTAADEEGSHSGASRRRSTRSSRVASRTLTGYIGPPRSPALPMEGGSWDGYTLTQQARQLLQDEPLLAGHVLRDGLHSARTVVRAAAALVTAHQEGDSARMRMCEQVLSRAVTDHKAAPQQRRRWASAASPDE
jgi:hypothetical protein